MRDSRKARAVQHAQASFDALRQLQEQTLAVCGQMTLAILEVHRACPMEDDGFGTKQLRKAGAALLKLLESCHRQAQAQAQQGEVVAERLRLAAQWLPPPPPDPGETPGDSTAAEGVQP